MIKNKLKEKSGQSLIEVMVALSVLSVGLLGIFSLLSQSLGYSRLVSDQNKATYLSEEGIEVVKSLIDHNQILRDNDFPIAWNEGLTDGSYELEFDSTALDPLPPGQDPRPLRLKDGIYSYDPSGGETTFKRIVSLQNVDNKVINVRSTVTWSTRGGQNSITLEDNFAHWRE